MTSDFSSARIYTNFQGFSDLRLAARDNSPEALEEVAKQFEAIFIQMMLKSMRDASIADGIFDSDQTELYMGMFDQQISLELAARKSFGIADMMVKQLSENIESQKNNDLPITATNGPALSKQFDTPEQFIESMHPFAQQAARRLGVKAEVLIAQTALETGWGQKIIRNEQGHSSFNMFGIKSDGRWDGPEVTVRSLEYNNGIAKKKFSAFRVYESYQQSFDDYVDFIMQNSRYQDAFGPDSDAQQYIRNLQKAGYATDPHYAEKVIDIMERDII